MQVITAVYDKAIELFILFSRDTSPSTIQLPFETEIVIGNKSYKKIKYQTHTIVGFPEIYYYFKYVGLSDAEIFEQKMKLWKCDLPDELYIQLYKQPQLLLHMVNDNDNIYFEKINLVTK